mmetsp:Transcript_35007/g.53738  ORF Transcript_35007/g.53738 Transcript_35007/m.53738 type:complete len:91 (-) Transcript_35007:96-368(-)|eukprot:CAMPEP_0170497110 /NCGR_PEP_ID=MMETSP0208-20121228/23732_1 /TAXON_ID=197538 /ORGANISM="Strombidium inclinatum, Strain S3" /LENGTH=90 /DNA_ID=CAMNT_0010773821 /DNA_START=417 /DNA_END=689 /DNA_ORIENTATION=+
MLKKCEVLRYSKVEMPVGACGEPHTKKEVSPWNSDMVNYGELNSLYLEEGEDLDPEIKDLLNGTNKSDYDDYNDYDYDVDYDDEYDDENF